MHLALPVQIWLPLGLALFAPLFIVTVALPISRRRLRGIATVLALRTVGLLALGFFILAALATFAVVHTGLRELRARHLRDLDVLAGSLGADPFELGANDARPRMELFRAKDADIAIVAASPDSCASRCVLVTDNRSFDRTTLRARLGGAWPTSGGQGMITIDSRPYLLIASSGRNAKPQLRATVIAAIDAGYLADQAAHTAWLLVAISYGLLLIVGWSSWQQVSCSLATRIHALNTQLLSGNVDESHEKFDVGGHELRELADSVSAYIKRTLEEKSSNDERYRRLVELAPDAVLMCADTRIHSANPAAIALAGASNGGEVIASNIDRFLKFEGRPADGARTGGVRLATWTQLDGTALHVEVAEIADSIGGELVRQFVIRDVTHSRRREADLAHRAEHDSLTGLVNRARFESRLRELLAPG
jgi:PAS domain-containing protein